AAEATGAAEVSAPTSEGRRQSSADTDRTTDNGNKRSSGSSSSSSAGDLNDTPDSQEPTPGGPVGNDAPEPLGGGDATISDGAPGADGKREPEISENDG
ncbi:unnamed protein product, partial [Ectocarpus sp. 12 AP-2014]